MTAAAPPQSPAQLMARARETVAPFAELYPFEHQFARVNEAWMHYVDEGPRDTAPLLCVHGNPTWSFYFREVVREFSPERRVLAVDHVGCGLSEKPLDYRYDLAGHVANLERLVLDLDLRDITLVLHDWGGAIGMGLARLVPERIARIVVTNTAAFRSKSIPLRISVCRLPVFGELAIQNLNAFSLAALRMATAKGLPRKVAEGLLAPYRRPADRVAQLAFVRDIPMRPGHRSWETLTAIEESLESFRDRPACILWGERDWCFTPEFRREWERRWPHASVHRAEDAGHYLLEDAGPAVLGWVRTFLEAHPDT